MDTDHTHRITVCTSRRHESTGCRADFERIQKLGATIAAAGHAVCAARAVRVS